MLAFFCSFGWRLTVLPTLMSKRQRDDVITAGERDSWNKVYAEDLERRKGANCISLFCHEDESCPCALTPDVP